MNTFNFTSKNIVLSIIVALTSLLTGCGTTGGSIYTTGAQVSSLALTAYQVSNSDFDGFDFQPPASTTNCSNKRTLKARDLYNIPSARGLVNGKKIIKAPNLRNTFC